MANRRTGVVPDYLTEDAILTEHERLGIEPVEYKRNSNQNPIRQRKRNLPPQTRVQVGNHHDELWNNSPAEESDYNDQIIDNDEFIDTESLQGLDPVADLKPKYRDSRTAEEKEAVHRGALLDKKSQEPQQQTNVVETRYLICFKQVKETVNSPEELSYMVNTLIHDYKCDISDIIVYKCTYEKLNLSMQVKIG